MTTLTALYTAIDQHAPYLTQESYDNSGINVGDPVAPVRKILLALDASNAVIEVAAECGADTIVCHHPVIWGGIKNLRGHEPCCAAVKHNINILSAHTNFDRACGGVCDCMAELIAKETATHQREIPHGADFLRVFDMANAMSARELAGICKKTFNSAKVRVAGADKIVHTAAVAPGAGGSMCRAVFELGANALVTGECKWSDFVEAQNLGMALLEVGHYESEFPAMYALEKIINAAFPDIETVVCDWNLVECG